MKNKDLKLTLSEIQGIETDMLRSVIEICDAHQLTYYLVYGSALGAIRHSGPIPWDSDVDIAILYSDLNRFSALMRKELPEKYYFNFFDNDLDYPELLPRIGMRGYSSKRLHIDVFLLAGAPENVKQQKKFKNQARMLWFLFKFRNFNQRHFGKFTTLKQKALVPFVRLTLSVFSRNWIIKRYYELCEKYPLEESKLIANMNFGYGMKEFIPKTFYREGTKKEYNGFQVNVPEKYDEYLTHIYGDYMKFPKEEDRRVPEYFIITAMNTDSF